MRALRSFAGALSYFTTIPVGRIWKLDAPDAFSLSFVPLIGAGIGAAVGWTLHALLPHVPISIAILVAALVFVALTGSIHIDGFLDCADALLAYVTPQRRLEILKDPRHGTFAVVAMVVLGGAWIAALASLASANVWIAAIALGTARCAAIVNAWLYPYARGGAVTAAFETRPNALLVVMSALLLGLWAWLICGARGVTALVAAFLISLLLGRWAARKLAGGLVGDVYGMIVSALEPFMLLALTVPLTV